MRSLVVTQVVPSPGEAGPKIKTHFALRTLAERHDVELVTFVRSAEEESAARRLEAFCARVTTVPFTRRRILEPWHAVRGWSTLTPFLVRRDYRSEMEQAIRDRLAHEQFDILHADQLTMVQYLSLARPGMRTVFDSHNAVFELVREVAPRQRTPLHRTAAEIEWRLVRRFEGRWASEADLTLAVSEHDAHALQNAAGRPINFAVVPIGIEARDRIPVESPRGARSLLSVATMHYPPNAEALAWFRDAIWPRIRASAPEVTVDVVGPRPPQDLLDWGRDDPRVTVHGFVEDLDVHYRDAAVFIVPLRSGSGVRVKVLEALALGVPVVSTSIGIDGLDLTAGEHLLVADDPAEFADAVVQLVQSPERRAALAEAGRRRVVERYDWRVCCRPLLDAYDRLNAMPRALRPLALAQP